jgi:hypothetical protein
MNVKDALTCGQPVAHPDMIGAYLVVGDILVHRDNPKDFKNLEWIKNHHTTHSPMSWFSLKDLIRDDWEIIFIQSQK